MHDRLSPLRLIEPPPPALRALVHYFHVECPAPGAHQLPASPFPILVLVASGATAMQRGGTPLLSGCEAYLAGPFTAPHQYLAAPGTAFVAALLRPGVAQDLFGIDQRTLRDGAWPLTEVASGRTLVPVLDALRVSDVSRWPALAGDWLLRVQAQRPCVGRRLQLAHFHEPPRLLAGRHGLGLRQFERRFAARYGLSPRQAIRLVRFTRALSALMSGGHRGLADLALRMGYYDQAQMGRDFIALAGHSPGLLAAPPADAGLEIFRYRAAELHAIQHCERNETLLAMPTASG